MPLQQVVKNMFSQLGYRLLRESTYHTAIAEEAMELARRTAAHLDVAGTREGSLSEEEYAFMRELVQEASAFPGPIIEIGTLFGRTTSKIALWKLPQAKILTLDNYVWNPLRVSPEMHFHLTSLVLQYLIDSEQVVQIRCDKDEWFSRYSGEPPAMVFCDADHSYEATVRDIRFALRSGAAIVCGHDYSPLHPGTVRAVDEHGGPRALKGSVWVLAPQPA